MPAPLTSHRPRQVQATVRTKMLRRAPLWILFAIALGLAGPAHADDTGYPFCLVRGSRDCRYATLEQCKATASGWDGTCIANPFYAPKAQSSGGATRQRRARR